MLRPVGLAVDTARKAESRVVAAADDATLKRTKYVWLKNPANFTTPAWDAFAAPPE